MTVESILAAYQAQVISRETAVLFVCRFISPDNVNEIMPRLPPEFIQQLRQWDLSRPVPFFASNTSAAEAQRIEAHQVQVAFPAIRGWFSRHPLDGSPTEATLLAPQEGSHS